MSWDKFCWETLDPEIHLDINLTSATYLNIVAQQVHSFVTKMFSGGIGIFQQENAPCQTAQIAQEWFEEHDEDSKLLP